MNRRLIALIIVILLLLTGCTAPASPEEVKWQRIEDSVDGTTVNFYVWTEDESAIAWFTERVAKHLENTAKIKFVVTEKDREIVFGQLNEQYANPNNKGTIDLLWLDEDAFQSFYNAQLLYGPFARSLENSTRYFNLASLDNRYIGATETHGYLVPFNQSALTFYYNRDALYDPPQNLDMLKTVVKENPGKFTYPNPQDPIGGAFVRTVILNFTDAEKFIGKELSQSELAELVQPGLDYLKSLSTYLHKSGKTYPETADALHQLYAKGDLFITMSDDFLHAYQYTGDAIYPEGTRPFLFSDVVIGQKQYLAIPFNAQNKSGAMVAINETIGYTLQLDKLRSKDYRGVPVYDTAVIDEAITSNLANAVRKKTVVNILDVMKGITHDIPQRYHEQINALWQAQIGTKTQ